MFIKLLDSVKAVHLHYFLLFTPNVKKAWMDLFAIRLRLNIFIFTWTNISFLPLWSKYLRLIISILLFIIFLLLFIEGKKEKRKKVAHDELNMAACVATLIEFQKAKKKNLKRLPLFPIWKFVTNLAFCHLKIIPHDKLYFCYL